MTKVITFREVGGPEVLQFDEVEFEDPGPGELRLRIGAIGLNRMEIFYRMGGFGPPNKLPAVLGSEAAGTVEAIGEGVTGFEIGDRVATIPGFTTVPGFETAATEHDCAVYGEKAYVPAEMAVKMPADMSFTEGAAIWMVFDSEWWFANKADIERHYSWLYRQLLRIFFHITPIRRLGRGLHYHFTHPDPSSGESS
jgi:NADPH:quinone reductase-like Zn-dependent oxidoreductase